MATFPRLRVNQGFRALFAAALLGCASLALALPAPRDIEQAVAAGNLAQAENMLREVLQEKPQSAKAHYELGQVLAKEARYAEALRSLERAKDIDPALKFAASPEKFHEVFNKVTTLKASQNAAPVASTAAVTPATSAPPAAAMPSGTLALGVGILAVAAFLLFRASSKPPARFGAVSATPATPASAGPSASVAPVAAVTPTGFGARYAPQPAGQAPHAASHAATPAAAGSGATLTGAVLGGVAGVAAGYALSRALEGGHRPTAPDTPASGGYVPFETPAANDTGGFDPGNDADDWGDAPSDDTW
ncbi:MAG: hypothetical protein RLZZ95_1220 [Pseudomonadota bacterium]